MKPIRIVHILHSFGTGGLEKGLATIVGHSSPEFDHIILCVTQAGESVRLLSKETQVISLGKSEGNSVRFIFRLSKVLKTLAPDIVHTRNWSGMDGIIAARLAGIRTIIQGEHGWGIEDPNGSNVRRMMIRRFLSMWVEEYTCVSNAMTKWLKNDIKISKPVNQIYNGVDTMAYFPVKDKKRIRSSLGISADGYIVGIVGRLDPIKDHRTLFQAFSSVRKSFPQTQLLVVGDGPERKRLNALHRPGIHFLGNRQDVADIMKAMDLFVLSSINEGISNTILEAKSSGLPIVATRVGGNPELIEDGKSGLLVPPKNPDALARAIERYILDPGLCRRQGMSGRDRIQHFFSIQKMVLSYENVYRRIALKSIIQI